MIDSNGCAWQNRNGYYIWTVPVTVAPSIIFGNLPILRRFKNHRLTLFGRAVSKSFAEATRKGLDIACEPNFPRKHSFVESVKNVLAPVRNMASLRKSYKPFPFYTYIPFATTLSPSDSCHLLPLNPFAIFQIAANASLWQTTVLRF